MMPKCSKVYKAKINHPEKYREPQYFTATQVKVLRTVKSMGNALYAKLACLLLLLFIIPIIVSPRHPI